LSKTPTLAMADEYISIPKDGLEERFVRLEAQVYDISKCKGILMLALESKFEPFMAHGNSNEDACFDNKPEDKEEL